MLKGLLVDDEQNNLDNLELLLNQYCEGISVASKVRSAAAARKWLSSNDVDVVFLDIEMPVENGFQFLESLTERPFRVIFITAYNEYAIRAIRANALDYLLKPVQIEELQQATLKLKDSVRDGKTTAGESELLSNLLDTVNRKSPPTKIALPQLGGISFVAVDDIVSLQADSNYTIIHLVSMQKIVISKTLKEFEEILDSNYFCRIHKSYIVNLKYIKEYSTSDGGMVKMTDGNQWSISRRQSDVFLEKLRRSSLMFNKS